MKPMNNTVIGKTWLAADVDDAADPITPIARFNCFAAPTTTDYYYFTSGYLGVYGTTGSTGTTGTTGTTGSIHSWGARLQFLVVLSQRIH